MLKIHCFAVASQRKAVSGVVETPVSLSVASAGSVTEVTKPNDLTTSAMPLELPLALQTQNLAGTVLTSLKTLSLYKERG